MNFQETKEVVNMSFDDYMKRYCQGKLAHPEKAWVDVRAEFNAIDNFDFKGHEGLNLIASKLWDAGEEYRPRLVQTAAYALKAIVALDTPQTEMEAVRDLLFLRKQPLRFVTKAAQVDQIFQQMADGKLNAIEAWRQTKALVGEHCFDRKLPAELTDAGPQTNLKAALLLIEGLTSLLSYKSLIPQGIADELNNIASGKVQASLGLDFLKKQVNWIPN